MPAGPGRGDELLQRAVYALNNQHPDEAERIARDVLKAIPQHTPALHVLGRALLLQGRAEDAIALLEPASRSRHDPEIDTQLAAALRKAGRDEDALARLRRTTKRQPYPPALRELGSLLYAMERYDEAIEALRRGVEGAPMMPDLSIQLGYAYYATRNCTDAKAAFGRALQIAPNDSDALFGMARSHQGDGENQPAVDYFRRYLISRPDHWGAWLSLGHCLLELGQLDAGYECFRTAARGDPKRSGNALASLVKSSRGRFWVRPSAAVRFLLGTKI
ncbi:MAG TPA: tetratricopeptide repeat protein [Xanthobacteraceae bacterium]|jgi:tetratricopeptide (TPR) repeat protein|nr:tetratricopeptide repeat protein [Xanthobacteraceae bacterium]